MKKSTYHIFFSKLSNSLRISIVSELDRKSCSVSYLSRKLKVEQSKLSHALHELKRCNIVKVEQKGKQRIYSLTETIKPILRLIDYHSKKCCNYKRCRRCLS